MPGKATHFTMNCTATHATRRLFSCTEGLVQGSRKKITGSLTRGNSMSCFLTSAEQEKARLKTRLPRTRQSTLLKTRKKSWSSLVLTEQLFLEALGEVACQCFLHSNTLAWFQGLCSAGFTWLTKPRANTFTLAE